MVVCVVDFDRVSVLEPESHPPIPRHGDGLTAFDPRRGAKNSQLLLIHGGTRRNTEDGKGIFCVLVGPLSACNCHILSGFRQLATKPDQVRFFGAAEWPAMGTHKGRLYGLSVENIFLSAEAAEGRGEHLFGFAASIGGHPQGVPLRVGGGSVRALLQRY